MDRPKPRFPQNRSKTRTPILTQLEPKQQTAGVVKLRLYDPIDSWGGYWGVSASEFADVLDNLPEDTTEIHLHVNSPGGDAFEGIAILNLLRQHPAEVRVVVEGIAASAASFIAMAGDTVVMAPNSTLMIHDASGGCWGQGSDMQLMADILNKLSDNIASIYATKAGSDAVQWREAMQAESWYTAAEAVEAGLADEVLPLDDAPEGEPPQNRFDLTVFNYAGRDKAPAPPVMKAGPKTPAPPSASGSTTTALEDDMSLSDALRERLGIADENADEDTILAALDEALQELADEAEEIEEDEEESEVSPVALAEVTRLSTEVAELRAAAAKKDKDDLFASWLRDGKTSPAERKQLEAMYDAAPSQTAALVNARAVGSVVPVAEIGDHSDGDDDDRLYAELFGTEKVS